MKKYITKQSNIKGAGKGLFTKDFFKKGEVIGLAHVNDQPASEIGRNHNHNEKNPTAYSKKIDNKRFIYASKNLKPGEEITTNYRMQPELEQPEDFMREGGALLTKKVTCKSCGWKWDAEDGGKDITTCHKCGGQGLIHAQKGGESNVKFISSKDGVETPIYKKVDIRPSKIHGNGLFTKEAIKKNEPIGICHVKNKEGQLIPSTILGMYNHNKKTPNVYEINKGDHVVMMPLRDISPDEELTADYDMVPIEGLQDSSSFRDGGESECPEGYIIYNGQCVEWQEPEVIETDENTGYNAATGEISQDTRPGSIQNNGWWTEHEKYHHLQNLGGGASTFGFLGQRPNNFVASDQAIGNYYDRRNTELEAQTDAMIKADPNLQFIPRNKLQEFTEGFPGANALMYQDPTTEEGEARVREEQFEKDGESMFPKKQDGGITNDYIELELTPEEIQKYKDGGYVVEELPEMQSGGSPSQVWYQYTGTPWSEARKKGLTDGSKEQNIELRKRILAGEFGEAKVSNKKYQNVQSNYDKNVKKMVAQGKTLDQLVQQKVGTKAGLKSRFPELFKTKSKLDNFMPKNYNSSNSSSSKNKNTKSRWGNVTVKSNDGKPSYRKDDYIDMVQSKDSKTKAEGLAMQAEHKKQLETEKLKKQLEYLKDSGFDSKALLANAKNQRDKIIEKPKVYENLEAIPGINAVRRGSPTGSNAFLNWGEGKAFSWDDNKGLLEQKWFPFSKQISESIKQQDAEYAKNIGIAAKEKEEADFQYREAMIKENPEISIEEVDQFIQDQKDEEWLKRQPSVENNYNDGPVQMVYPEKYFIGPGGGIVGNLFRNPYVMGAGNLYFGTQGISEWVDSDSDLRKSIGKAWDDPTWSNIGDFGYELGMNALNFSGLPFGKIGKIGKNVRKTTKIPIIKYGPFKPRKLKTINLNQNPGWLQLPKVNSKGYFEYKKYQDGGNVSKTWEQKTDNYELDKEIISDLSKEEINKLVSQGYIVEQIN